MKYFWDSAEEIKNELLQHSQIVIFFDFDGTLAPIVREPEAVQMTDETKNLLNKLIANDRFRIVIISGRDLENIKEKVNISGIAYAANHGMEWEVDGKKEAIGLSEGYLKTLGEIKSRCQELQKQYVQVMVQDKKMTVSIHYRAIDGKFEQEFLSKLRAILDLYVELKKISLIYGKKVIEIRPFESWTKGDFVQQYVSEYYKNERPYIIYLGDDTTDEDAFKVIQNGLTIFVGQKTNSRAKYYLKNVDEVQQFMKYILKV